jgi:two-component system nitrate/nitrite sensor histidine kinase NarX
VVVLIGLKVFLKQLVMGFIERLGVVLEKTNNKVVRRLSGAAILAPWNKSIALQVLVPFIVIGGLALTSMLVSVWVTADIRRDAEVINLAGSMRMHSYRIASHLQAFEAGQLSKESVLQVVEQEADAIDSKLQHPHLLDFIHNEEGLEHAHQDVVEFWQQRLRPVVLALQGDEYVLSVTDFVASIDGLVTSIQLDSEGKNDLLGMYQGMSIVLSVMALLFVGMRTDQNVVSPLKDLVQAAEHAERGDFSYRAYYEGADEAGLLCKTFNKMSESVARSYAELEGLVERRTRELILSNRSLDFLYQTSRRLSSHQWEGKILQELLDDLREVLGVGQIALYRASEPNSQAHHDLSGKPISNELQLGEQRFVLEEQGDYFGYLSVKVEPGEILSEWQYRLLTTVIDIISSAMALQYQENVNQRLMIFEERSVIARELHDSLAQSLSYLNLQTQRLNRLMEKKAGEEKIRSTINDMQDGLSTAYKHLRELLTTFRMKINAPTLQQALHAVIEEFKPYDKSVKLSLDFAMDYSPLTPNEDIHVLQVMREAMNNALKHAQASEIVIRCQEKEKGSLSFAVIDDGVGMKSVSDKEGHYGMQTMRERAEILEGNLTIESVFGEGTQVGLTFEPLMWRQSPANA